MVNDVVREIVSELRMIPIGIEGDFFMKPLSREKATDLLVYIAKLEETVEHGKSRDITISKLTSKLSVAVNGINEMITASKSKYPESGSKDDLIESIGLKTINKMASL